jgi:hypothetical protein
MVGISNLRSGISIQRRTGQAEQDSVPNFFDTVHAHGRCNLPLSNVNIKDLRSAKDLYRSLANRAVWVLAGRCARLL